MEMKSGKSPRKRENREEQSQIELFKWIKLQKAKYPVLGLPYHVPNGGDRHIVVATKLKAMGARAGVWDIYCPPDKANKKPLYIEMKDGDNDLTKTQETFQLQNAAANLFEVCYSWDEAANIICRYYEIDLSAK